MAKKSKVQLTPEETAEKANPGWKAVRRLAADAEVRVPAEAVAVDAETLLAKHGRAKNRNAMAAKPARPSEAAIVQLESKTQTDRLGPRRSSVIQDGKEVGQSG